MSGDFNALGALGFGSPAYDPAEAKGYLNTLKASNAKTETDYKDVLAQRRQKVADMSAIVDHATNALVQARIGRSNLPLMAAGAALMGPTRTGGLGESIGNALGAAVKPLQDERTNDDNETLRTANLRTVPLTAGEAIDKDETAQLAARLNANQGQMGAVARGAMTAQAQGMKAVAKDLTDLRKQAQRDAKDQMTAMQKNGALYTEDETEVVRKLQERRYAELYRQRYGMWPTQLGQPEDAPPTDPDKLYPIPKHIEGEKKDERAYYDTVMQNGQQGQNNLSALQYSEPTGKQVPGMLAGPALYGAKLAEAIGLGGDWGKQIQDAGNDVGKQQAILRNFALAAQSKQKGVQTEGDFKRINESIANVSNTSELNKVMYNWMKSQALSDMYQADVAGSYVSGQRNRATGIHQHMNDNTRFDLVHSAGEGKNVTLWEYYEAYKAKHPEMKTEEAQRRAVETWKAIQ